MKNLFKSFSVFVLLLFSVSLMSTALAANTHEHLMKSPHKAHVHQPSGKKEDSGMVDINNADLAALESLKGVGAKRAQAIVDYRETNGAFASVNDLAKVKGVGEKGLARIMKNNEARLSANPKS